MSFKNLMLNILSITMIWRIMLFIRQNLFHELPVLTYHRVLDVDEDDFIFDINLVSASVKEFRWQMSIVKKYYTPIHLHELLEFVNQKKALPKNSILITFDDGYDDNYLYAYPILKKLDIPATLFISTGYVDKDNTYWYDWLAYIVNNYKEKSIKLDEFSLNISLGETLSSRRIAHSKLVKYLTRVPDSQRKEILKKINELFGKNYQDLKNEEKNKSKPMGWGNLHEMSKNNISIQSHSVNHPVLNSLEIEDLSYELAQSRKDIQQNIKDDVYAIAYPIGLKYSFDEEVIKEVKNTGYKLGFSYISGMNRLDKLSMYKLKRIHVERYIGRKMFLSMLSIPEIYS